MLEVVLGTVFILLVLSLFATTIMEIINSLFSLRGKFLIKALKSMLAGEGRNDTLEAFLYNPRYKQLTSRFLLKERPPSYISATTFSSILWDIIFSEGKDDLPANKINEIKDKNLRSVLMQLYRESNLEVDVFKEKTEEWYEEVMERSVGWFKRNTQTVLLIIGLFIAIVFDADTLAIFRQLSNDPESQLKIAGMVDNLYAKGTDGELLVDSLYLTAYQAEIQSLLTTNLEGLREPLGLGWYESTFPKTTYEWLFKALGWLITALAVSLGAPFWFDLLKKIMSIRSSGYIPQPALMVNKVPQKVKSDSNAISKEVPKDLPVHPLNIKRSNVNEIKSYG